MSKKNGYILTRKWFDFAFEKSDAKCHHTSIYLWLVELNNRFAWKSEFGVPTKDTMEGLSIGNKSTYLSAIKDLNEWGFIKIVKESKNQYQSMIVHLCHNENEPTLVSALDTALKQHSDSIESGIGVSTVPIVKQVNKKTKKYTPPLLEEVTVYFLANGYSKAAAEKAWSYYNAATPPWTDSNGKKVRSWKQKMQGVWFKPENKLSGTMVDGPEQYEGYEANFHNVKNYTHELIDGRWHYKLRMLA